MVRRKRKNNNNISLTLFLMLIAFLYGFYFNEINKTFALMYDEYGNALLENSKEEKEQIVEKNNNLKIYYLDVGQADSILINSNNEYMLIDGGNNNDGPLLVKYFQELGIKDIKYIVGTHPHEDHIGGLDEVINNFNINQIFIPDVITTTKTFEDLLDSIERKNLTFTVPTINNTYNLGEATIRIIYTGTDTSDLNNSSIILKLTYKKTSYLFTGDATNITEKKILNKDIKSDVLKIGHHGSKYSSTENFIKKVNPKYAIISVGKGNKYGHPSIETINLLKKYNIKTYRTDELGTILLTSDGNNIEITSFKTNTNGG